MWIARTEIETAPGRRETLVVETAPTKAALVHLLRQNHEDTRKRTVTRDGDGDGYWYTSPGVYSRSYTYHITRMEG